MLVLLSALTLTLVSNAIAKIEQNEDLGLYQFLV